MLSKTITKIDDILIILSNWQKTIKAQERAYTNANRGIVPIKSLPRKFIKKPLFDAFKPFKGRYQIKENISQPIQALKRILSGTYNGLAALGMFAVRSSLEVLKIAIITFSAFPLKVIQKAIQDFNCPQSNHLFKKIYHKLFFPFIVTPAVLAAVLLLFIATPFLISLLAKYALIILTIMILSPFPITLLLLMPILEPLVIMGSNLAYGLGQLVAYPLDLGKILLRTLITLVKYGLNFQPIEKNPSVKKAIIDSLNSEDMQLQAEDKIAKALGKGQFTLYRQNDSIKPCENLEWLAREIVQYERTQCRSN